VLLALVACGPAARAEQLCGRLDLVAPGGARISGRDVADAVVWFSPARPVHPEPGRGAITTREKTFIPRVFPVTVGSTVSG
jgi:hypothetical protein